jgi:UDP-3-O-[3-hydroxymyristoyl] N-acetylglucosamine deacetylase
MAYWSVTACGHGLHTGRKCTVKIESTEKKQGIVFHTPQGEIPVNMKNIYNHSRRCTELRNGKASLLTVEHLMSVLLFAGDNIDVTVNGPEVPVFDGSAKLWVEMLSPHLKPFPPAVKITGLPVTVTHQKSSVVISAVKKNRTPAYTIELDYTEKSAGPGIFTYHPFSDDFKTTLAAARTFAFLREIKQLKSAGLIKGGSLSCALVLDKDYVVNKEGKRFKDEPARHKMLDLIGDLALLGALPAVDIFIKRPGHALNHAILKRISAG